MKPQSSAKGNWLHFSDWLKIETLFGFSSVKWRLRIGCEIDILFRYSFGFLFHSHAQPPEFYFVERTFGLVQFDHHELSLYRTNVFKINVVSKLNQNDGKV
jgi:hypothetical protein